MKIFQYSVIFASLGILFSCDSNLLEKVKNGVLSNDVTIKIGDAFDGYRYFTNRTWKEGKDTQGRSVVSFSADIVADYSDLIQSDVVLAKKILLDDKIQLFDFNLAYGLIPEKARIQAQTNEKEANRIINYSKEKDKLHTRLKIIFAKSLKDNSIVVISKKIVVYDEKTGIEAPPECDTEIVATNLIDSVFGNIDPAIATSKCILNSKIIPINELPGYPKKLPTK